MKIAIAHLSDIHMNERGLNWLSSNAELIVSAFKNRLEMADVGILVITGDLTYRCSQKEFEIFETFFLQVWSGLVTNTLVPLFAVAIPGNHDCDTTGSQKIFDAFRKQISTDPSFDSEMIRLSTERQRAFFNFITKHQDKFGAPPQESERLVWPREIQVNDSTIRFTCLNSAWLSQIHEQQGTLIFPVDGIGADSTVDTAIALIHHPYNWYESNNARDLSNRLEREFDVVITGHEHVAGSFTKISRMGAGRLEYIQGGALQSHEGNEPARFNFVELDVANSQLRFSIMEYSEAAKMFRSKFDSDAYPFLRKSVENKKVFSTSKSFEHFLSKMDVAFTHPKKELSLFDVYVYPDTNETSFTTASGASASITVKSQDLLAELVSSPRTFITGGRDFGKSSLAKSVFRDLRDLDLVPILLSGVAIDRSLYSSDDIIKLVSKSGRIQYENWDDEKYIQLEYTKRVLIIDDFHKGTTGTAAKERFLYECEKLAGKIIVIADEVVRYDEILERPRSGSSLMSYRQWSIKPFGKRLTDQLVGKWMKLDGDDGKTIEEFAKTQGQILRNIIDLMESRTVPALPIFILTLLQQISAGAASTAISGSHGFLYKYLIQTEIAAQFGKTGVSLSSLENYLSHLAYWLFFDKGGVCSDVELSTFHQKFTVDLAASLDFQNVHSRLQRMGVLIQTGNEWKFGRPYYQYHFAARYLANLLSLRDPEARKKIVNLVQSLHLEANANIIISLCSLTTDRFIREEMLRLSRGLYPGVEKFDFYTHVEFLGRVGCRIEEGMLQLDAGDPSENRRRALEQQDSVDGRRSVALEPDQEDRKLADVSIVFNKSLRAVHVLGQMLRSYTGQIPADEQKEIAEECFGLSMRMLRNFVAFLDENALELVGVFDSFSEHLSDRKINPEAGKRFLYLMTMSMAGGLVERTANVIGADDLKIVFANLVSSDGSISTSLIDLMIKLNFGSRTPVAEIREMESSLQKRQFAKDVLHLMVVGHLNTTPLDQKERQQIVSIMHLRSRTLKNSILAGRK